MAQVNYFPPDFPADWYAEYLSDHLSGLEESSLWESSKTQRTQSYRFLWLRTWNNPIAIRIDVNVDGTSRLTTKMASGQAGFGSGRLTQNKKLPLTQQQTDWFLERIEVHNFWKLPLRDNTFCLDGAAWIIEGVRNGTYHIVERWSPISGGVRDLGLYMVSDLAKMKLAAEDVY